MAKSRSAAAPTTKARILEVAIRLMQERGYNGFSFQDVAREVGVSHVAIHHHYPAKSDLATAAIADYTERWHAVLMEQASSHANARETLRAYARLFAETLRDATRVCLCGMLAAEFMSLPAPVCLGVRRFYEINETWLADVLRAARTPADRSAGPSDAVLAKAYLAALEGALLSARAFADVDRLIDVSQWFIASLGPPKAVDPGSTRLE